MTHRLPSIRQRIVVRGMQSLQASGGIVRIAPACYYGGGCMQLVLETM